MQTLPRSLVGVVCFLTVACQLDRQGRLRETPDSRAVDASVDAMVDGTVVGDANVFDATVSDATANDTATDTSTDVAADGSADGPACTFRQPQCDGNDLLVCGSTGIARTTCALGCRSNASGGHCAQVVPSNVESEVASPWNGEFDMEITSGQQMLIRTAANQYVDLSNDNVISGPSITSVHDNGVNTDYTVVRVRRLIVRAGGTLWVRGFQPAIILASENVLVEDGGRILVGASERDFSEDRPPAGGGSGGAPGNETDQDGENGAPNNSGGGGGGEHGSNGRDSGGAGGSFGTIGGRGGNGTTGSGDTESGGEPGAALYNPNLIPLRGGGGGGGGGNNDGGRGGDGGGALQISSATQIVIARGGIIDASGQGGRGGRGATGDAGAGGGGGAGGAVLLEAPSVTVLGVVSAIGGAGGRGMTPNAGSNNMPGIHGTSGYAPALLAMGARFAPATPGNDDGGEGGQSANASAGSVGNGANGGDALNGGGGGGGNGVIHVRTQNGDLTAPAATNQSGFYPPQGSGASSGMLMVD